MSANFSKLPVFTKKNPLFFFVVIGLFALFPVIVYMAISRQNIRSEAEAITAVLVPAQSSNLPLNQPLVVNINVNSGANVVYGIDFSLTYGSSIFSISLDDVVFRNQLNDSGFSEVGNGTMHLVAYAGGNNEPSGGVVTVAQLTFHPIAQGTAMVSFVGQNRIVTLDSTNNSIYLDVTGTGGTYGIGQSGATATPAVTPTPGLGNPTNTPTPTPTRVPGATNTPTPTPTPTGVPSNAPTAAMKFKFQGVLQKRPDQKVKLTVISPSGQAYVFNNINVTSDANGVWSANVPLSGVPTGNGYIVLLKGPMHLQRKYCDPIPTPTSEDTEYHCGSIGHITLAAGENKLDFTNTIVWVGDLPPQDGVMNARDASELRQNLGKSDADALSRADVNFDGVVNTTDFSLLLESMIVKYDEER